MRLVCYKGCHDFLIEGVFPQLPRFFNKKTLISWEVVMDIRSVYYLPGDDQRDWNKGGGQTFNWLNHLQNSAMWGWRYNPLSGLFEYSAYCHVDGQRVIGTNSRSADNEVMLQLDFGQKGYISLYTDYGQKLYRFTFNDNKVDVPFSHNLTLGKEITANFGGNNVAPSKTITNIKTIY